MAAGEGLDSLIARALESFANATLRLDKASEAHLAPLEGRTAQVESTFPDQVWCIRVRDARIEVSAGLADSPDVVAKGAPGDLLAWFAAPESRAAERVEIDGDTELLAELAGVFRALAPTAMMPPTPGEDLLGAAELAAATLNSAAQAVAGAWREATRPPFVNRSRFSDLKDETERLQSRVVRLAERVEALESKQSGQPAGGGGPATGTANDPDEETAQAQEAPE